MARQQAAARKPSRSKRDTKQESDPGAAANGADAATYEQELAEYLQERIKPGLNRGAIPLLARSLAKEIARRNQANAASEESDVNDEPRDDADDEFDDEPRDADEAEVDDDPEAEDDEELEDEPEAEDDEELEDEAEDEPEAEGDEEEEEPAESEVSAFEEEMHELQADLGDDWILRFSVQGEEAWLTAEKQDGSQHLEAPTADLLREAVELLDEGGGRSG